MAARRGHRNIGGFGALANILADDYMLGNFVHRQGLSHWLLLREKYCT